MEKEERELLSEKKAEKDMLISEVQILSALRFNIQFNYLTVHLCKHPHPLLPEPETHNTTHARTHSKHCSQAPLLTKKIDTDRHVDSTVGGQMCKKT